MKWEEHTQWEGPQLCGVNTVGGVYTIGVVNMVGREDVLGEEFKFWEQLL